MILFLRKGGWLWPECQTAVPFDAARMLWITEMCRVLDISTKTGYRLLKNGDISSLKIGRAYRIPKAHLLAYLKIRKASGLW